MSTTPFPSVAEIEQLAADCWYDLDTRTATRITERVAHLSDIELLHHPLLAVSALLAECSLTANREHLSSGDPIGLESDRQPQLRERIAALVEALPQSMREAEPRCMDHTNGGSSTRSAEKCDRCAVTTEHWQLLRMMAHRWRQRTSAEVRVADALTRNPNSTVSLDSRTPGLLRSHLDQTRPGLVSAQRAITYALVGRWADALSLSVRASRTGGAAPRRHYAAVNGAANAALITAIIGHTARARDWITHFRRSAALPTWCAPHIAFGAQLAETLLNCDQVTTQRDDAAILQISELSERSDLWPFAVHALNRANLSLGNADHALQRIHGLVYTHNSDVNDPTLIGGLLLRDYCDTLLELGEGNLLLRTLDSHPPSAHSHLALAHTWLRNNDAPRALLHATQALRTPQLTRRNFAEAQLLCASAHLLHGDEMAAAQQFRQCVADVTLDFPVMLQLIPVDLLTALSKFTPEYGARVLNHTAARTLAPIQIVHLTPREHTILEQLAWGRTPQQIATADVVSLHTVRTQLKMLYRKLNARSAAEAVAQASTLGVLIMTDPAPVDASDVRAAG